MGPDVTMCRLLVKRDEAQHEDNIKRPISPRDRKHKYTPWNNKGARVEELARVQEHVFDDGKEEETSAINLILQSYDEVFKMNDTKKGLKNRRLMNVSQTIAMTVLRITIVKTMGKKI